MPMDHFEGAGYLRLRGLPFNAQATDVCTFLDNIITQDSVHVGIGHDGRPSGEAWVQLADQSIANELMSAKNNQLLGSRYIELFQSAHGDWNGAGGKGGKPFPQPNRMKPMFPGMPAVQRARAFGGGMAAGSTSILRVRGLPFVATQDEVAHFFADFGVEGAFVIMGGERGSGRPSGEAWVEFGDTDLAEAALSAMNKKHFGHRYVDIFRSSEEERNGAFDRPGRPEKGGGAAGSLLDGKGGGMGMGVPMGATQGMSSQDQKAMMENMMSQMQDTMSGMQEMMATGGKGGAGYGGGGCDKGGGKARGTPY